MAISGVLSSVTMGANKLANCDSFSVDIKGNPVEIKQFGQKYKETIDGLKEWTGTVEGNLDIEDTSGQLALLTAVLAGSLLSPKFYINSTNYYSGSAYCSSMKISSPLEDAVKITYDLTGTGEITKT